jgi:Ca2+-binding RTX toxin-like protein
LQQREVEMATIHGTEDTDFLPGTEDDDEIYGYGSDDGLRGFGGNDRLYGGDGNDLLTGDAGSNLLDGGAGFDRARYHTAPTGVTVSLLLQGQAQNTGISMDTLIGIEHVSGSIFDDILIGDDGANWLWGNAGNDNLTGNGGDDLLQAGDGDHVVNGGGGSDTFALGQSASAGVSISLASQGSAQNTGIGSVTLTSIENLSGGFFNDVLTGGSGANTLAGDEGDDTLSGGSGNDLLLGDGFIAPDTGAVGLSGPIATFYSLGELDGNDTLDGGSGNDSLYGAGGDDTLYGGSGNDVLHGGGGRDVMNGGSGSDRFLFEELGDSAPGAADLITGFDRKSDRIDLSAIDANENVAGDQAFTIVKHGFTGAAGQAFIEWDKDEGVSHIFLDVNGDMVADMTIDVSGHWTPAWNDAIVF